MFSVAVTALTAIGTFAMQNADKAVKFAVDNKETIGKVGKGLAGLGTGAAVAGGAYYAAERTASNNHNREMSKANNDIQRLQEVQRKLRESLANLQRGLVQTSDEIERIDLQIREAELLCNRYQSEFESVKPTLEAVREQLAQLQQTRPGMAAH